MAQQMVLPEGGLASFISSNMDEFDDSRLVFGRQNGINSMRDTAERMAQMGRNGDVHIAHLQQGEGIVPREVLENNPELAQNIGYAIANEGADPSAYVVGSDSNSINPYTGQREFFLKKLIGGVKNILKAVAPIVIPMALNFFAPGMGTMMSGFIGGGITALAQGKNFKDSLKAGLIGGAIGGISSGLRGVFAKGAKGTFAQQFGQGFNQGAMPSKEGIMRFGAAEGSNLFGKPYDVKLANDNIAGIDPNAPRSVAQKFGDYIMPKAGPTSEQVTDRAAELVRTRGITADLAQKTAIEELTPGIFEKYGGPIIAGTTVAAALGGFSQTPAEEVPEPYDKPSASEERLAANPEKFKVGSAGVPTYITMADTLVQPNYNPYYEQYLRPQQAADGGEMFPRRNGYIAGPGTETSDDIPAMLSDGEFVMTAQAVRGVGNGSRQQGVRKMYDMMRAFEGGAVA